MTREKKELLKQLKELNHWECVDSRMDGSGECGGMIARHYDALRQPILDRLDVLMHGRLHDFLNVCYHTYRIFGLRSGCMIKVTIDTYQYADLCMEYELNREHYVSKGFKDIDTFVKSVLSYNN